MFYDTDQSFFYMAVFWIVVTALYGVSLHITLRLARIELEGAGQIVVILVSSLAALVPAIGPYLAFLIAGYLIYRMADASFGMIIGVLVVTLFVAMLVAFLASKGMVAVGFLKG